MDFVFLPRSAVSSIPYLDGWEETCIPSLEKLTQATNKIYGRGQGQSASYDPDLVYARGPDQQQTPLMQQHQGSLLPMRGARESLQGPRHGEQGRSFQLLFVSGAVRVVQKQHQSLEPGSR